MKRVLVLIHFANKLTREAMAPMGVKAAAAIKARLQRCAGVFSSDIAFGFVGVATGDTGDLLKALVKDICLKTGDNISVMELTTDIISTHPGLMEWQGSTVMVSAGRTPARQASWPPMICTGSAYHAPEAAVCVAPCP